MIYEQLTIMPADWFPEFDSKQEDYVEERTEVYRIVDDKGVTLSGYVGRKSNKPYYTSLKGARVALHHFPEGSRIQKGEVTWSELPKA